MDSDISTEVSHSPSSSRYRSRIVVTSITLLVCMHGRLRAHAHSRRVCRAAGKYDDIVSRFL